MPSNLNRYFAELKKRLISATNDLLGYPKSNKEFTKTDLQGLADAIKSKLEKLKQEDTYVGETTISWELLRNMICYSYPVKVPTNKKVVSSLTKICLYLDFNSWGDFIANYKERGEPILIKGVIRKGIMELNKFIEKKPCNIQPYFSKNLQPSVNMVHLINVEEIKVLTIREDKAYVLVYEEYVKNRPGVNIIGKIRLDGPVKYFTHLYELVLVKDQWLIDKRYKLQMSKEFF